MTNYQRLMLLAALFGATAIPGQAQSLDEPTRQAVAHYEANRPARAGHLFRQTATSQPTPDHAFFLGRYYIQQNQPDSAQAAFQKGLDLDSKNYLNKTGLVGVALLRGQTDEARTLSAEIEKKAKRRHPDWLYRLAEMNLIVTRQQNPDEALRLINKVLTDSKVAPQAAYYLVKGDALKAKNKGAEAMTAYESALKLDTRNAYAPTQIGLVLKASKNYNAAHDYFVKALAIDSTHTPAYDHLGDLYLLNRNYQPAAYYYKKMVDHSEPTDSTLLRYTRLAFLSEDYKNMLDYLERVRQRPELNDNNVVRRMYAYAYVTEDFEKYDEARELMQQVLNTTPEAEQLTTDYAVIGRAYAHQPNATSASDALALVYLTRAAADTSRNYYDEIGQLHYKGTKNYVESALAYQKSLEWKLAHRQRVMGQDYYNLGRSAYLGFSVTKDHRMLPKADSAFARLIDINPSFNRGPFWRARVNRCMADSDAGQRAIDYYQTFIEQADSAKVSKKDLIEANTFIGYQLYRQKEYPESVTYLQKTLDLDPDNRNVENLLDYINRNELADVDEPADTKTESEDSE